MEPVETKEYFIKCLVKRTVDEVPQEILIPIDEERIEDFYDAQIEFDIVRKVTLVEETSITELTKKGK